MHEEATGDNLNTIEEMILDEQRLVTYATVSKELCIHVNVSKLLLNDVAKEIRKNHADVQLNVTYIVSGLCEDNKARTTVCPETEIATVKKSFKIVFFDHVYSISKGAPFVDNVALMAVNKFEDFPLCVGVIKGNSCTKRSLAEIGSLKTTSQDIASTSKPQRSVSSNDATIKTEVGKPKQVKSAPIIKNENMSPKKQSPKKSSPKKLSPAKSKNDNKSKPKSIAGFFSKPAASSKKPSENSQKPLIKPEPKEDKLEEVKDRPSKSTGLFSKQDGVANKKPAEIKKEKPEIPSKNTGLFIKQDGVANKKTAEIKKEKPGIKEEEMEVDVESPSELDKSNSKSSVSSGTKSNSKKKNQPKNKLAQIKKNAKVDKKRKRVLQVDSESDDDKDPFADDDNDDTPMKLNQESDDEIPPTPAVNTVKITSGILNPKKRRKIVDKTFTDDEGYILTKKVEVYESCSDEEGADIKENLQNRNQAKTDTMPKEIKRMSSPIKAQAKGKKKISPPKKGQQATLMNFFKKA